MACPLCGAQPQNQDHNAACDGNVAAVTQAAAAEIAKIRLLQAELHSTVAALTKEHVEIVGERKTLAGVWQQYQKQIDTALSPDFSAARKQYDALVEKRAKVRQADVVYKRIKALRRRLDEPTPAPPPKVSKEKEEPADIEQYICEIGLARLLKDGREDPERMALP